MTRVREVQRRPCPRTAAGDLLGSTAHFARTAQDAAEDADTDTRSVVAVLEPQRQEILNMAYPAGEQKSAIDFSAAKKSWQRRAST